MPQLQSRTPDPQPKHTHIVHSACGCGWPHCSEDPGATDLGPEGLGSFTLHCLNNSCGNGLVGLSDLKSCATCIWKVFYPQKWNLAEPRTSVPHYSFSGGSEPCFPSEEGHERIAPTVSLQGMGMTVHTSHSWLQSMPLTVGARQCSTRQVCCPQKPHLLALSQQVGWLSGNSWPVLPAPGTGGQ